MQLEIQTKYIEYGGKESFRRVFLNNRPIGLVVPIRGERTLAICADGHGELYEADRTTVAKAVEFLVIRWRDNHGACRYCGMPVIPTQDLTRQTFHQCIECWITEYEVVPVVATKLRAGLIPHTANCPSCRRLNRAYCERCVD